MGGRSKTEIRARRDLRRGGHETPEAIGAETPILPCAKVPYPTEGAAEDARDRLHSGIPHKCWCGAWHLTTSGKHHGRRGRP